jgi:alkaline phosphatase D
MGWVDTTLLPGLDRRALMKGALSAGLAVAGLPLSGGSPAHAKFRSDPFTLGIASGEPASDGFVIWTRLAPIPLNFYGGMAATPVSVTWEVAEDAGMLKTVRSGETIARPELAHSVHVEVAGLKPARDYFYRFHAGDFQSPIGRARTFPFPGAEVAQLRFAAAGCQAWEGGYYTAWRAIAAEHFDFAFHYGDYIYEHRSYSAGRDGKPLPRAMPANFRTCYTLTDYRRRYALYKSDPDLQAAHASCAFLPSFDDHEVADNWASDSDPKATPPEVFLFRRAAAFQAWYEHMPVRSSALPRGPDILAYRNLRYGALADLAVLDTRQYRSRQACNDGFHTDCREAAAATRTMMGARQERWLAELLRSTSCTWQVLAQQVMFAQFDWRAMPWIKPASAPVRRMDTWDGAGAGRDRVLAMLRANKTANPVVLTGDAHFGAAFDIKNAGNEPESRAVAVEFLATSISSGGDGSITFPKADEIFRNNPHLKFIGNERGYSRHVVTRKCWQADYRVVERVSVAGAPVSTRKSFVVEAGRPGLMKA